MEPQLRPLPPCHARHVISSLTGILRPLPHKAVPPCDRQQQKRLLRAPQHSVHASQSPHAQGQQRQPSEPPLLAVVRNPTICGTWVVGQIGRRKSNDTAAIRARWRACARRRHGGTRREGRWGRVRVLLGRQSGKTDRECSGRAVNMAADVWMAALLCHAAMLPCPALLCWTVLEPAIGLGSARTLRPGWSRDASLSGSPPRCWLSALQQPIGVGSWISIPALHIRLVRPRHMCCRMRDLVASSLLMMRGDPVRAPVGRWAVCRYADTTSIRCQQQGPAAGHAGASQPGVVLCPMPSCLPGSLASCWPST